MANWASTAYAIEGPNEILERIKKAIVDAIADKSKYCEEYLALVNLGYSTLGLDECRLGGNIVDEPDLCDGVLRFWAEEKWGLQDFNVLLKKLFPEIKIYWVVEESGCEVYCTNDKEGKYFPERYWVDTCIDDNYQSEYFRDKESMYKWLSDLTGGRVTNPDQVDAFNSDCEDSDSFDENFISIHEFQIEDEVEDPLSKEQEEEFKKDFENWIVYGEAAMEVDKEGNFRSLSMEEFDKLKAEIEGGMA